MNVEFLKSMGELLPPRSSDFTITTNLYGDVVMLKEDGNIYFGNVHSSSSERNPMEILEVDDVGHVNDSNPSKRSPEEIKSLIQRFTHIEFDSNGKVLLLWGKEDVAIVIIPDSLSRDGFLHSGKSDGSEKCKFMSVYGINEDASGDDIEETSTNVIVKACFHPFNSSAIAILRQSKWLKVINVSQYESHVISLDDKVRFSSCCFGPRMLDFSSFSLFLLATSGAVYFVSPIIPRGTAISGALVGELWSAVSEMKRYRSSEVVEYSKAVESFLQSWLPLSGKNLDESAELVVAGVRATADMSFSRVFRSNISTGDSKNSLRISASTHYSPLVQGPIARTGTTKNVDSARRAVDICVPSSNAFTLAPSRQLVPEKEGAPVLFVSYSDGTVESLLLDNEEQELSLVFPSWKSMNRLKPDVTAPSGSQFAPRLVPLEVNKVETKSTARQNWMLTPDPVIDHYIHVTSHECAQSYLLVCRWLERALQVAGAQHGSSEREEPLAASQSVNYAAQEFKDSRYAHSNSAIALRGAPEDSDEEVYDDDGDDDFLRRRFNSRQPLYEQKKSDPANTVGAFEVEFDISAHQSQLVPIVDLFDESSAAGHAQQTVISGLSILRDPFAGHTALFRTLSNSPSQGVSVGEIWAVNLTVHSTLCDLHQQLANRQAIGERARKPFQDMLHSASSEQAVRWRHSRQLIATIGEGLKKMPQVIHQAHSEQQQQQLGDAAEQSDIDALNKAALQVQKEVLLPMSELLNVTKFHFELVEETHAAQLEVLQGASGASNPSAGKGIFQLLSQIEEDQKKLTERISRIRDRYAQQRESAERHLTFAINQTNKLSRGEVLYKKQLEKWSAKVVRMGDQVNAIQRLLPRRAVPGSVPSSPLPLPLPPPSSPAAPLSSSTSAVPGVSSRFDAQSMSTPSPGPSASSRTADVGPSPILPSASPLMAAWRSPMNMNTSYEPSGRRADRSFASNHTNTNTHHGNSVVNFSFRIDHSVRAPMGKAGVSMTADEQQACQDLLAKQLNMAEQSKESVLKLEERLRDANRMIQQRLKMAELHKF